MVASSLGKGELLIILFLRAELVCIASTKLEPVKASGETFLNSKGLTSLNLPLYFIFFPPEALALVVALTPSSVEYLSSSSSLFNLSELT